MRRDWPRGRGDADSSTSHSARNHNNKNQTRNTKTRGNEEDTDADMDLDTDLDMDTATDEDLTDQEPTAWEPGSAVSDRGTLANWLRRAGLYDQTPMPSFTASPGSSTGGNG